MSDGVPGRDRCGKEMKLYWRKIHMKREKLSAGGRSYERHRERERERLQGNWEDSAWP